MTPATSQLQPGYAIEQPPPPCAFPTLPQAGAAETPRMPARISMIGRLLTILPKYWWMILDAAIVIAGLHLGYWMFRLFEWEHWEQIHLWQAAVVLCPTVMLVGLLLGLHQQETLANRSWIVGRVLLTISVAVLVSYAFISLVLYDTWSRWVAASALGCYAVLGITIRLFAAHAIRVCQPALLFIGETPDSDYIKSLMEDSRMAGYRGLHHLNRDPSDPAEWSCLRQVDGFCRARDIGEIVIHSDEFNEPAVLSAAFDSLRRGRRVTDAVTFFEKTLHRVPVDHISPEWFLFADLQLYRDEQATLKRIVDVVVASVGLVFSIMLAPFIALAIKIDSRGPVFYSQDRVGLNGSVFRLYKFRTMATDAEGAGVLWSFKGDKRVTRVGGFLRRTRLDELPQLWNILLGQMSMVGPRPERPQFVAQLNQAIPFYDQRHLIKPGLTGWAQINYRYGSCVEDAKRKLEYDLYYMKHMSVELDLVVLTRTFLTVLKGNH